MLDRVADGLTDDQRHRRCARGAQLNRFGAQLDLDVVGEQRREAITDLCEISGHIDKARSAVLLAREQLVNACEMVETLDGLIEGLPYTQRTAALFLQPQQPDRHRDAVLGAVIDFAQQCFLVIENLLQVSAWFKLSLK